MLNEELCKCKICRPCRQRKTNPISYSLGASTDYKLRMHLLHTGDTINYQVVNELCKDCFHGEHFNNEEQYQRNHETKKNLC